MEIDLHEMNCCSCKILFWVSNRHNEQLRKSHETFYCPNGHAQSYLGESVDEKLKKSKRQLVNAQDARDNLVRSNSALRGVITKLKKKLD